jgi:hypothetical protein
LRKRPTEFDRLLIDWADEFIQDLVASFSATRPTPVLRLVVVGLYVISAVHLVWAAALPFFRGAVEGLLSQGAQTLSSSELSAFATSVIIGRMSYHLLLALAYILLSFVVRATRSWTRAAATVVLVFDVAVSVNGLRAPRVAPIFLGFQWMTLGLSVSITVLLWLARTPILIAKHAPRLSNGRASF